MSANNQLVIALREGKFKAFDLCIEDERSYDEQFEGKTPKFEANDLREALVMAQKYCEENIVEYNYLFVNY